MTVIQSNRAKKRQLLGFLALGGVIFAGFIFSIVIYSQTVTLKHDIIQLSSELEEAKIKNAELKSSLYQLTSQKSFEALAEERGLIQDKSPKWVFASGF